MPKKHFKTFIFHTKQCENLIEFCFSYTDYVPNDADL